MVMIYLFIDEKSRNDFARRNLYLCFFLCCFFLDSCLFSQRIQYIYYLVYFWLAFMMSGQFHIYGTFMDPRFPNDFLHEVNK